MTHDVRHGPVGVRDAAAEDAEFLLDMLMAEVNWGREDPVSRRQLLRDKVLSHYVAGWGSEGDLGLVAVDTGGPNGLQIPVGAAWLRYFAEKLPGHAFIAESVPELTVGVTPPHRDRGIELALIKALAARAREAGVRQISVTVAEGHSSRAIYDAAGFTFVRTDEHGHTLVLSL